MSDETQSFLEFLDEDMPTVHEGSWQIDNDGMAIWALRKIAQARAQVVARAATVRAEMEKLTVWLEQAQRQATREEAFFEGKLHGYLLHLQDEGHLGAKKSWTLPNGRLQLRRQPARWEIVDADALMVYASEHDVLQVTVKPDLGRLRERCAQGIEVPGLTLARQAMELFSVTLTDESRKEA